MTNKGQLVSKMNEVQNLKKIVKYQENVNQKKAGMAVLIANKIYFKVKSTIRRKKGLYTIIKIILNKKIPQFKIIIYLRINLRI